MGFDSANWVRPFSAARAGAEPAPVASAAAEMAAMPEDLMKSRRFRDSVLAGMGEFLLGVVAVVGGAGEEFAARSA